MKRLALLLLLAAAPALADPPRMRCSACTLLPDTATATNLTVQSATLTNGGAGTARGQLVLRDNPAQAGYAIYVDRELSATRLAICLSGSTAAGCLNGISVDGTATASFSSAIAVGGAIVSGAGITTGTQFLKGGVVLLTNGNAQSNATDVGSNVANSAGNSAFHIYNATLLTKGQDRYIATLYNDSETTVEARIFTDGTWSNVGATGGTAGSGTGITTGYTSAVRPWVHKQTIINTALTAAGTTDLTVWTTPVNTRIVRITANVTQVFTGGALTAVTFQCGNAAGGNQYLVGGSVFTAQTTLGDVQAEVGAGLLSATLADMGTPAAGVPGAIAISCRFTCTTANCNAATQGSLALYIEGVTY